MSTLQKVGPTNQLLYLIKFLDKNIFDPIIVTLSPERLILFEISEFALYQLERELLKNNPKSNILAVLGDINDKHRLKAIMQRLSIIPK